ncbi:MAG: virulence RhuM family protein [Candidatus Gastranaerophilaceae bacterium]|nr:virulence RhuM family protein [Candidatus Gastranaerophilaceae bacterium]
MDKDDEKKLPEEKKNNLISAENSLGEFLIYTTPDGEKQIQVRLIDETVWLSQRLMADLFQKDVRTINEHILNVFAESELPQDESVIRKFRITASDGKNYDTNFYSLDMIISVGYRVKSLRGTQFRQWATQRIKEYLIKGFTINTEYLKNPEGKDYFEELLKEIREIRASEKRFYAKIKDIYATSVDYDKTADVTRDFFAMVQNKMLWAVTGQTAAEIIHSRANAEEINMGLTTWNGKKLLAPDVVIAKNYLKKDEMEKLDRLTVMYLDYAELQAERRIPMTMVDWATKLDGLLSLNEMEILTHKGKISKELAEKKAKAEYHKYDEKRRQQEIIDSDIEFAKEIEEIKRITKKDKE